MHSRNPVMLLALLLCIAPVFADEDIGVGPWRLGMSKEQVVALVDQGPYKDVGDAGALETGQAAFSGHKANALLEFNDKGLRTIRVTNYTGSEWAKARDAALEVFDHFASAYGGADVKEVSDNISRKDLENILLRTLGTAEEMNKQYAARSRYVIVTYDMVPRRQPAESRLHCQWVYNGKTNIYSVFLYQDRTGAPSRVVSDNVELQKL